MRINCTISRDTALTHADLQVYQIRNFDWIVSPSIVEAVLYCKNELGYRDDEFTSIKIMDLEIDGMWYPTNIQISSVMDNPLLVTSPFGVDFGSLYIHDGYVYEFISYKRALLKESPKTYLINSIED